MKPMVFSGVVLCLLVLAGCGYTSYAGTADTFVYDPPKYTYDTDVAVDTKKRLLDDAVYVTVPALPVMSDEPKPEPVPKPESGEPKPEPVPKPEPRDFTRLTAGLEAYFAELAWGDYLSVLFHNIESGFTFTHNPERVFFSASVAKINHAFFVYTLAERGWLDMYTVHEYTEADWHGGTGNIQYMDFGAEFTTRQLLWHSIVRSCNVAHRMLVRYVADAELSYHDFVAELGANPLLVRNIINQNVTVADAGLWMYAIFHYLDGESRYGRYFAADLRYAFGFIRSTYPVAQKIGWAGTVFNDAAIVYAPSPYILVILSGLYLGGHNTFRAVSMHIQEQNTYWFG